MATGRDSAWARSALDIKDWPLLIRSVVRGIGTILGAWLVRSELARSAAADSAWILIALGGIAGLLVVHYTMQACWALLMAPRRQRDDA